MQFRERKPAGLEPQGSPHEPYDVKIIIADKFDGPGHCGGNGINLNLLNLCNVHDPPPDAITM